MTKDRSSVLSRRTFAKAAAVLPLAAFIPSRASAAEFDYKLGTGQDPSHPNNLRMQEALDRIREKSGGRLDIKLFPANQLGSDTDLLGQLRNGGIDFQLLSTSILAVFVPVAGILNTAYAFTDYDVVWKALDGGLGSHVQGQIEKSRLVSGFRIWDNGFRQITSGSRDIRTPEDLKGFKIRVPQAPMLTSFFSAMAASPTPLNFNEVYTSLQTKVIEGQENPLAIIATAKLYEVQKYCSMSSHSWDGYWPLANRKSWEALPSDMQQLVIAEFDKSSMDQRADVAALSTSLRQVLIKNGMDLHEVDKNAFRAALAKTSYYRDWKAKYGDDAWGKLEDASGKLAI